MSINSFAFYSPRVTLSSYLWDQFQSEFFLLSCIYKFRSSGSQEGAFRLLKLLHVKGFVFVICVDVFRIVGQIYALLMHPEAAHGAGQRLECH